MRTTGKLGNEWRHTLEDDEADFISSVLSGQRSAEAERQAEIDAELAKFRRSVVECHGCLISAVI